MRESGDAIIREQWVDSDSAMLRQPPDPVRTSRSIETVDASERYEARFAAWERRLEEALDDDIENGGDGGSLSGDAIAPWLAASILEMVDQAVAGAVEKMRVETGALRRSLDSVTVSLASARRSHVEARGLLRAKIGELESKLADQAKAHAEERQQFLDELRTLAAEQAEQRAVADLRHSRSGQTHAARVRMKLVRGELEREAKGAA